MEKINLENFKRNPNELFSWDNEEILYINNIKKDIAKLY